jgi:hypothetical protein
MTTGRQKGGSWALAEQASNRTESMSRVDTGHLPSLRIPQVAARLRLYLRGLWKTRGLPRGPEAVIA